MEENLFEFSSLDGDVVEMKYYDVKITSEKIGRGKRFDLAVINYETAQLSLYDRNGPISEYIDANNHNLVLKGRFQLEITIVKDMLNEE